MTGQRILHHKDCAQSTGLNEHAPMAACVDKDGHRLPREEKPVTDELLTRIGDRAQNIADVAKGAPIPKVGDPQSQYQELEFEEQQVGQVMEGEVWKGTFMPHARPEGPRVEMTISDHTGISITVAAEVPAEMRHLYDWDMLTSDVTSHARRLYEGIESAERA